MTHCGGVPNRWLPAALVVAACAACAVRPEAAPAPPQSEASAPAAAPQSETTAPSPTTPPAPTSATGELREWKARAAEHFTASAQALEQVSRAAEAEDEAGLLSGCQQLHDANSTGLQQDLPTPDRRLTAELQQMIDDMNTATHSCLRFALSRKPAEADNYREYLARAMAHLQRAKATLNALEEK